jgi:hypothetical protein
VRYVTPWNPPIYLTREQAEQRLHADQYRWAKEGSQVDLRRKNAAIPEMPHIEGAWK